MRRTITVRRAAAALALPLALSGLAACGSDSDPAGSSKAADPGVEEGEEIAPADFVDSMQESFEDATTAHVTMTNDGQFGINAEGDVDYSTEPPSMRMTMENEMLGGEIETVMVDGVMYMQMGAMGGDKFIKMDLSEQSGLMGEDLTSRMDPSKALESMEAAIKTVTYEGEQEVDGEALDHYTLVIDTRKMLGKDGAKGMAATGMPAEMPYEIWFDDDGMFRRTSMDMGEKAGKMVMTLDDWGKDVEIEAPPADQVTEMPEMPQMPESPQG